jgi:hypothetical protein
MTNNKKGPIEQTSDLIRLADDESTCPFCEIGTLVFEEAYDFFKGDKQGPFLLPADICTECGEYMLTETDMEKLINERDRREGKGYIKTTIRKGELRKYVLH